MDNAPEIFEKSSPWMRLAVCMNIHVKKALLNIVHNVISEPQITAIPSDSAALYTFLQNHKNKIRKSTHIKAHQKSILLPTNGQSVDSESLDISLIRFLIQTFNGIKNAKNDWNKPDPADKTLCAFVFRAADLRNQICHENDVDKMDETTFEEKWEELKKILQGLKYVEDIEPYKTLKYEKLKCVMLKEFLDHLRSYKEECLNKTSQDDYIHRQFCVDGNKNDVVTESDLENLIEDNDTLVVYGEAGIGKSSTARRIKNEWHHTKILNGYHLIFYDSKRINKQLTVESTAAAIYFSELGDYLRKNERTMVDLSIYNCVKTAIDDLIILIDGIDEFPVREIVKESYTDNLERKVMNNEKITGTETIIAIYFGFLFPDSKVFLLGRISEFESLKKVKVKRDAAIFNRRAKNLELIKFDDENVKDFTCIKICKQQLSRQIICTGACQEIYNKIRNIELCKIPTDLNSLIELCKKHPNKNIGKITRTKLIIATLLKRLNEHVNQKNFFPCETFGEIIEDKDTFIDCIRILGEISFNAVYKGDITIKVENQTINNIVYFQYENLKVDRKTLEALDLFYVRDLVYYLILEPHHTLNIEFLSACFLFSHPDKWDSILGLNKDRQLVIISFIAGLYSDDLFTKDFTKNVLETSSFSLEQFFSWLYNVENVRYGLPDGGFYHNCWYGLMENQKISPSFFLLNSISREVEIPQNFIPETIVCFLDDDSPSEWYNMEYFNHNCLTKLSDKFNIELFQKRFPGFKFFIQGNIWIVHNDEFNRLDQYCGNNKITFKINQLSINTQLDTYFSSCLNSNTIFIWWECDSRTIDMVLSALLPPTSSTSITQPTIKCKRLRIDNINHFNGQQTEKLFALSLSGVVDYIALERSTFFTDEQVTILKNMERNTKKRINIQLRNVKFNCMFDLVDHRHISLNNVNNVTNIDVNEFRKHISTGYTNNIANYKIINHYVPFVRKENKSQDCEQSMYLHLHHVNFKQVSPQEFAKTFSLIPSLSCHDYGDYIPSSHWQSLSQTEDCQLKEMRVWFPQSKNFDHFQIIKTNTIQFICKSKNELKQLLNHIANDPNIQLDKNIKVFVVEVDEYNWDYYDEIALISGKTIEKYKENYRSDDLLLDDIDIPFHEGDQHLKWWCCEISLPNPGEDNGCLLEKICCCF